MEIDIELADIEEKSLLQRMIELYQYDFSEYDGSDLDAHGMFGYPYLDHYWVEENRHPYLVRVDGKLAGFVLVSRHSLLSGEEHSISEFFILRKYRRQGVGRKVAGWVFDQHPGKWEVCELDCNPPAQAFWRKVIAEYTGGNYQELILDDDNWKGPVQMFDNSGT